MGEPVDTDSTECLSGEPEDKEEEEVNEEKEMRTPILSKQESLVLYSRAALSPDKMCKGSRKGRKPRNLFLKKTNSVGTTKGPRKPLVKQQSEISTGSYHFKNTGCTHPEIIISGSVDAPWDDDDSDGGPRTPLPVLPIVPPEENSDDENEADTEDNLCQLPDFLFVAQRYRRSSLVRMDAVKQPGSAAAQNDDDCRRISVHGSLDLKRKDLSEFRNAVSFSAAKQKDDDDTITISEIRASGGADMLNIPDAMLGKHKRKGSRRKRPSLRRLLTVASEPKLNREELEERHEYRKKAREERRKERKERKLKEKQKQQEEMYDEYGVSKYDPTPLSLKMMSVTFHNFSI